MISRLMSSYYLERMAHDKYFLTRLCKDERLKSANTEGSKQLQEYSNAALAALEMQQVRILINIGSTLGYYLST